MLDSAPMAFAWLVCLQRINEAILRSCQCLTQPVRAHPKAQPTSTSSPPASAPPCSAHMRASEEAQHARKAKANCVPRIAIGCVPQSTLRIVFEFNPCNLNISSVFGHSQWNFDKMLHNANFCRQDRLGQVHSIGVPCSCFFILWCQSDGCTMVP